MRGAARGKVMVIDPDYHIGQKDPDREYALSTNAEWFNVCSQTGTSKYPYGDDHVPGVCVDNVKIGAEGDRALSVRDTAGSECRGTRAPFDQVYNMSGGNDQWINLCAGVYCFYQGGERAGRSRSCDQALGSGPMRDPRSGVRCCADAVQ